jgi:hypothetical protein
MRFRAVWFVILVRSRFPRGRCMKLIIQSHVRCSLLLIVLLPGEPAMGRIAVGHYAWLSLRQQTILNPVIDGELEEWQSRPAILLDEPGQVFFSPQPWREEDISGRFWLEFGPDELVLAASVQDDDPLFNRVSRVRCGRRIRLSFSWACAARPLRGVIKPGCEYQIGIAPTTRSRQPGRSVVSRGSSFVRSTDRSETHVNGVRL